MAYTDLKDTDVSHKDVTCTANKRTANTHIDEEHDTNLVDEYAAYAAEYDPNWAAGWDIQPRTASTSRRPKRQPEEVLQELTDEASTMEAGFNTTYTPSRYEATFLRDALRYFLDVGLIEDVLASVKGGKEASVYRCQPNSMLGVDYLAAKVYRPRRFRNLRNDKMYREGREVISAEGKTIKANSRRTFAAMNKKSSYGVQAAHASWMMHEFAIMDDLWQAGASVPRPYAVSDNAILMDYVGDGDRAAPTLHEIALDSIEARGIFDMVLDNIERMMDLGVIHGDLSAYNLLYWEGKITLIDFPQVVDIYENPHAREILCRDVRRVCDYFSEHGVERDADAIAEDFWQRYNPSNHMNELADLSRGALGELGEEFGEEFEDELDE